MSIKNEDIESQIDYTNDFSGRGRPHTRDGFGHIPGLSQDAAEDDSGLITSDSDFDRAAEAAGYSGYEAMGI